MRNLRVACLGDSITRGDNTSHPYPSLLQASLRESESASATVGNFGVNRAVASASCPAGPWPCVPFLRSASAASALAAEPSVVVLMLGTNDYLLATQSGLEAGLSEIISRFLQLRRRPTILLATPPPLLWVAGEQAQASAKGIRAVNNHLLSAQLWCLADRHRAAGLGPPLDTFHAFLSPRASGGCSRHQPCPRLFRADGLHPSSEGNALIAARVRGALRRPPRWGDAGLGRQEAARACCAVRDESPSKFARCAGSAVLPALLAASPQNATVRLLPEVAFFGFASRFSETGAGDRVNGNEW